MSALTFLTIWTLVLAGVIVLVVAIYLIAVAYYLYQAGGHKGSNLARLVSGLKVVRDNVQPLDQDVTALAGGLKALRDELLAVDNSLADAGNILGA